MNEVLWNTHCYKSMADFRKEREKELFTPMEILIMEHLRKSDDGFIATNETGLYEQNAHELYKAINSLMEKRIIRKRNCDAEAYEWDDKNVLLRMLG